MSVQFVSFIHQIRTMAQNVPHIEGKTYAGKWRYAYVHFFFRTFSCLSTLYEETVRHTQFKNVNQTVYAIFKLIILYFLSHYSFMNCCTVYTVHACDRAMCSFTHRHGVSKSNILRRLKCNSKPISCILFEKPTYMSCRTCRLRHLMIRSRRGIASLILCKHHFEAGHFLCAAHSKMM